MASVDLHGQNTPEGEAAYEPDVRFAADDSTPEGSAIWALEPDDEESGLITEIDVPFPEDVGEEGRGDDAGPAPSGMFSDAESAGADAIAHYKPWHIWG